MKVSIPQPLRSYTGEKVEADGATLEELLHDLAPQFPGIRFRMVDEQDAVRKHVKLFVNQTKPGDLILDTMCGSGTAQITARDLNRRATGYELNEKAFRSAVRRLGGK